jgi:hypothetical protein
MKTKIRKIAFLALISALSVSVFSCLNDESYTDLIDGVGNDKIILSWFGGKGTPDEQGVTLPNTAVAEYTAGISVTSSRKLNKDFVINVAVDLGVLENANAKRADGDKFNLLPEDAYDFSPSVTVESDTTEGEFKITFYQNKIDKTKNYMLPLVIQGQPGMVVASNLGALKLTFIGNPLAGGYTREYKRWNNDSGTGTPTTTSTEPIPFIPVNATSFRAQSGYGTQNGFDARYLVSFVNTNGVLSNFTVKIDPEDVTNSLEKNTISVLENAKVIIADPVAKHFKFSFKVANSAGAARSFTDEFTL